MEERGVFQSFVKTTDLHTHELHGFQRACACMQVCGENLGTDCSLLKSKFTRVGSLSSGKLLETDFFNEISRTLSAENLRKTNHFFQIQRLHRLYYQHPYFEVNVIRV